VGADPVLEAVEDGAQVQVVGLDGPEVTVKIAGGTARDVVFSMVAVEAAG